MNDNYLTIKRCIFIHQIKMQDMSTLFADDKYIKYDSVREAMEDAGVVLTHNSSSSVLVWYDSLTDHLKIFDIPPWKVINRIPFINILCRKVPFSIVIAKIRLFYPDLYSFYPKTFVIPDEADSFLEARQNDGSAYIVKPDGGSLGKGITIIEAEEESFSLSAQLSVAQEYVDCLLLDNTKFDLRIYALVASVTPLRVYVYRDGIARFCSEDASHKSDFARLTNVGLNRSNSDVREVSRISRLISDVFPVLEATGVDITSLWHKIDRVVALSVFAAYGYLKRAEGAFCPRVTYSRCFQVLGFDILIDKRQDPRVLEVNYRPSLDFYRGKERRMKVAMIRDAILLGAPMSQVQQLFSLRRWSWGRVSWFSHVMNNKKIAQSVDEVRRVAEKTSGFELVWPSDDSDKKDWPNVLRKVIEISKEPLSSFVVPDKDAKDGDDN